MSEFSVSYLPFWAVILPLLSTLILPLIKEKRANRFVMMVAAVDCLLVLWMYPAISRGEKYLLVLDTGLQINVSFMADALSILTGLVAIVVWMLASVYAVEYMSHEHAQRRYNIFSLLSLAGMLGVVFTGNLFTLYLFFELLSVASYVMVIHEETREAMQAGFIYLFMGVAGGLVLLFSIIATYSITGSGELYKIGRGLVGHPLLPYIFWGYVFGFGVKAGLFPVHVWLPSAHPVAPSPASALLSGIMIKAGAYGIIRAIYSVIGLEALSSHHLIMLGLLVLALINIVLGSAVAIKQTEIKKMLAYSSISQIGYIILGVALLTPKGILGGVVHIFNHAIIKGALFLCAGAFIHQLGVRQLEDLKGIGKRMPITMLCFTLAGLSMIGFPPFNGFISKWFLALGSLEVTKVQSYGMGVGILGLGVLLLSSFMNLVYYGPIIYGGWFAEQPAKDLLHNEVGGIKTDLQDNSDPNWWMKAPLLLLGFGTLVFGIFPQLPVRLAQQVSKLFFP
jgi:multicomponent Na+:H+ antiporter subunit D